MGALCVLAGGGLAGCETPGEPVQTSAPPKVAQPEPPRFPSPVPRPSPSPAETAARPQPSRLPEPGSLAQRPRPTSHVVRPGEDLYVIAAAYGIDAYALATANSLAPPFSVASGQQLALPPVETAGEASAETAAAERPGTPPAARPGDGEAMAQVVPVPRAPAAPQVDEQGFIWPVNGDVISEFGAKGDGLFNDGINIAASRGTPVRAADSGVVAYAGNELRGFGNMLLIKHPDGWVTAYAHTEELLVQKGERVGKGQVIARVGSTGSVSRPQLHFEMRRGKKAVDPLQHLRRPSA